MPVGLYFDHNISRAITQGLRLRDVDVLTAFEDGAHLLPDPELLDRATALGRPLFSSDEDLIVEARRRQREGVPFAGVIFAPQSISRLENEVRRASFPWRGRAPGRIRRRRR